MVRPTTVRDQMDVIGSCGTRLGRVDNVDGDRVKLTRNDHAAGGLHHWVPLAWVDHVDTKVHLNRNSADVKANWQSE